MVTYDEVFNRCMDDNDYPAIMTVESLCSKDLEVSDNEYLTAYEVYKNAKAEYETEKSKGNLSKKNWAQVTMLRAKINYLVKFAIYCDFMNN